MFKKQSIKEVSALNKKTKLKQIVVLTCLVFILLLPFFVFAETEALKELKVVGSEKGPFQGADQFTFSVMIGRIISAFLTLLGIFFICLMIIGGYNWMTAQGDESKVEKAKKTIYNAVIGLIITLSSYGIWDFVLYKIIIGV